MMTNAEEYAEYQALAQNQKMLYWEAINCGATHNDAMEAATTNGYVA